MSWLQAGAASALLLVGALLALVAALGLFRLPDVFGRMHAATKPAVLGVVLMLGGLAVVLADWSASVRLGLAASLQLFTAPVAMTAVGRAVQRVVPVRYEEQLEDDPDGGVAGP